MPITLFGSARNATRRITYDYSGPAMRCMQSHIPLLHKYNTKDPEPSYIARLCDAGIRADVGLIHTEMLVFSVKNDGGERAFVGRLPETPRQKMRPKGRTTNSEFLRKCGVRSSSFSLSLG